MVIKLVMVDSLPRGTDSLKMSKINIKLIFFSFCDRTQNPIHIIYTHYHNCIKYQSISGCDENVYYIGEHKIGAKEGTLYK